jgi:hypothetical protein
VLYRSQAVITLTGGSAMIKTVPFQEYKCELLHVLTDTMGYEQGRMWVRAEDTKFQVNFNGLLH